MSGNVSAKEAVDEIYNDSCRSALIEEEGMTVLEVKIIQRYLSELTRGTCGGKISGRQMYRAKNSKYYVIRLSQKKT